MLLGLLEPGATVAVAEGCYFGTVTLHADARALGAAGRSSSTRPARRPTASTWSGWRRRRIRCCSFPDLEAAAAPPGARARRRDRVVARAAAAARARRRPRAAQRDEVPGRPLRTSCSARSSCRDEADRDRLLEFRTKTGNGAAADPAWLLLRSLETLELRVPRQSATALELARRLADDPRVVDRPLPRPRRCARGALDARRLRRAACRSTSPTAMQARRVETSTRLIGNATSLGGVRSTMESRYRWEPDRVPPGLLRLSVGLEDVEALWADLDQALGA